MFSSSILLSYAYLLSISYGSVYFARDAVDGAVPAQITSVASTTLQEKVLEKYTIGPSVERNFWKKERSSMNISRGPYEGFPSFTMNVYHLIASRVKSNGICI